MTAPFLRTERLELWLPQPDDLGGMIELVADAETRRFLGPTAPDARQQFERLLRSGGSWRFYGYGSLFLRWPGDHAIVGSCGLFHSWRGFGQGMDDVPEAGWIVRRDHAGVGLAGEAMRAILAWFDERHGPKRITALIEDANVASARLAGSLGFSAYGYQEVDGDRLVLYERLPANPAGKA